MYKCTTNFSKYYSDNIGQIKIFLIFVVQRRRPEQADEHERKRQTTDRFTQG